jgi:hypothetical protein
MPLTMLRPNRASIRESAIAARSLTPSAESSPERSTSRDAACSKSATGPRRVQPSSMMRVASARLSARSNLRTAVFARRLAPINSMLFASQTVQVTREATASPIITAFTMMSVPRNIVQGERSCGSELDAGDFDAAGTRPLTAEPEACAGPDEDVSGGDLSGDETADAAPSGFASTASGARRIWRRQIMTGSLNRRREGA